MYGDTSCPTYYVAIKFTSYYDFHLTNLLMGQMKGVVTGAEWGFMGPGLFVKSRAALGPSIK